MKNILVLLLLNFIFIPLSYSACVVQNGKPVTSTNLLGGNGVTISNDMPNGTQLYVLRNFYNYGNAFDNVNCTPGGKIVANWSFTKTPFPLSSYGTGAQAGKVYETGLPGVGVFVDPGMGSGFNNAYVPSEVPAYGVANATGVCPTGTSCYVVGQQKMSDIYLIKTGNISPGVIRGEDLPCIKMNYTLAGEAPNDNNNLVIDSCFSGFINVVVPTCQTPSNIDVDLGTFETNLFKGKGSVTPWVDSSINLVGCPVFHGYRDRQYYFWDGSGANTTYGNVENVIELTLTSAEGIIDENSGILKIRDGNQVARGVGVQMVYGDGSVLDYVKFNTVKGYTQPKGTSGNIKIPLAARFIQTEDVVSPGVAKSVVVYTISYN